MPLLTLIIRIVVGAIIGWCIGLFLTRVTFRFDNYRLERKNKKMIKNRKLQIVRS